ncbi:MAG: hypothetical protein HXS51_00215 [Theionarchaea archaeon]|nr:hypothetical protein [Theionarchaea archaeon]MBU6999161.1 hypothetical protein [Theionarchaea archaeon]
MSTLLMSSPRDRTSVSIVLLASRSHTGLLLDSGISQHVPTHFLLYTFMIAGSHSDIDHIDFMSVFGKIKEIRCQ